MLGATRIALSRVVATLNPVHDAAKEQVNLCVSGKERGQNHALGDDPQNHAQRKSSLMPPAKVHQAFLKAELPSLEFFGLLNHLFLKFGSDSKSGAGFVTGLLHVVRVWLQMNVL